MKINHENTKENIIAITKILNEQGKKATEFITKQHEILNNKTMSQEYQTSQIEELRNTYYNAYNDCKRVIREIIETMLKYEEQQDNIINLDVPEYSNTISIINATQGKLSDDFISNIKYNFMGNYGAISTIADLLETYGVNVSDYGYNEFIKKSKDALLEIDYLVKNLERSEQGVFVDLVKIYEKIVKFGTVRGIIFAENEIKNDALKNEVAEDMIAKAVMGLK